MKLVDKDKYVNFWNRSNLHILQHYFWGELKAYEGWYVLRIEYDDDRMFQMQCKSLPLGIRFGYIPKLDPNLFNGKNIEELEGYFRSLGLSFVIFEFSKDIFEGSSFNHLLEYNDHVQPPQTNVMDLNKSIDDLFSSMDGKYRRNIKKGERDGVKIVINDNDPITDFYRIMESVYMNTKMLKRDKGYFQRMWELFKDKGFVIKGELDNELLGSYFLIYDNTCCYELYGGVNKKGRDFEAGYVLKWEAIKYAKGLGLHYYDHWGVAPIGIDGKYDKGDELYNISLFKKGFGGEDVIFPYPRVIICNRTKYGIFKKLSSINRFRTKLRKLF